MFPEYNDLNNNNVWVQSWGRIFKVYFPIFIIFLYNVSRDQYIEQYDFPFCEEVSKYEKQAKIGQGTFGEVRFGSFKIYVLSGLQGTGQKKQG